VFIGDTELRVIAREEAEGAITNVAVEYEGGVTP
jgi:hypothetical protein